MTEEEWLACDDPEEMLKHLRRKVGNRKLRLLAVACARLVAHFPSVGAAAGAVDLAESYADGRGSQSALKRAWRSAFTLGQSAAERAVRCAVDPDAQRAASRAAAFAAEAVGPAWAWPQQVAVLRDIFGNPFRPLALDPAWLTSDVLALARGIYAERAFDRMPIMADALQDAGCDNADVLAHCRDEKQVHVRGCWVVDLLLGKG